ncbi:MAG: hypothetical protein H6R26_2235, partial [Proteobacteria bacterium]|nr:hypothetical protein [Pseudomonadota bacterium]
MSHLRYHRVTFCFHLRGRPLRALAGLAIFALWGGVAVADLAGRQMLDDVSVGAVSGNPVIHVELTAPVSYARHAPFEAGDTLQVWVNPTAPNLAQGAAAQREVRRWTATDAVPLLDVGYEYGGLGGDRLILRFNKEVRYKVRPGDDFRSVDVELLQQPEPAGKAPQAGMAGVSARDLAKSNGPSGARAGAKGSCDVRLGPNPPAAELRNGAQRCVVQEDWAAVIGLCGKLLQQPDKAYHQEALELLGLARERSGQPFRAKTEYEKYLKLYPEGEAAARVRQRLEGLLTAGSAPQEKRKPEPVGEGRSLWETYGSFSQYYFREAFITNKEGEVATQSLFLTNLDVTSKLRTDRFDVRGQFDARYRQNFLPVKFDENDQLRVSNAFVDVVDRQLGLSGRLGRQSRASGGVMGRFDGGVVSYRFNPQWQATVVGGFPVRPYRSTEPDTDKSFAGMSLEFGPFMDYWAGNVFFINQVAQSKTDRRAVGGEFRYQHPVHPVFTLIDYDVFFNALNTAQVLANWNFSNGAIVTFTADYRKTPYLSTSNVAIGSGADSLQDALFRQSNYNLAAIAEDNTATMKTASLGGIVPLTEKLQLNGDVTVTDLSATKGSPWVTPYQGSGVQVSYAGQLIASSLFTEGDIWNLGLRYSTQQINDYASLFVDGRHPLTPDIRLDPRLRVDYFTGFKGADVWRVRPGLRFNYRVVPKLFLEMEGGFDY